ncbi:MAG: winged helix-turn-helix domain-containing protein [bacterium]
MLKKLFSSSIRADVLALLLNSPEEKFYVREIAKLLRKNPSGVKRELDNLEKMGIVIAERVANLKYFRANIKSPLYPDLKKLITKSLGLPGALKAVLRAAGATSAFIYGPYAEGHPVNNTVDLFVINASGSLQKSLKEIEDNFSVRMNAFTVTEAEMNERKKSDDLRLKDILKSKKILLLGRL